MLHHIISIMNHSIFGVSPKLDFAEAEHDLPPSHHALYCIKTHVLIHKLI